MFGMPTRHVVLTEGQGRFIQSLVDCGRYQNASALIREGLRLIRREAEHAARQKALHAAAATGIAAIEAGAYREFLEPGSLQTHLSDISDVIVQTRKWPS
jgi:antitoxin ParD1/3/4